MSDVASADELTAAEAAQTGLARVSELTGKDAVAVTEVSPTDDGWRIGVEVLEQSRIPSSSDMLAIYEIETDMTGELLSYRRTRRYSRGVGSSGNGA